MICHSRSSGLFSVSATHLQTSLYVYCQATDRQGNFAINDTILERVQLTEFNQTEDTIILFNREAGESHNYVNLLWGLM